MNDDKKRTRDLIIKIILIIIIIILLIHNCAILKKGKKERIPTGNVDIIEITCDKDDKCDVDNDTNNNDNNNQSNTSKTSININPKTIPVDGQTDGGEDEEDEDENGLIVKDKNITWNDSTNLKIFENSMYELEDKIAPESYNTYQFVVKNKTNYNLKYNITFAESNPYNINLKYKLRKNDIYLIDHYVSASELAATNMTLNVDKNDTYYLDWKWISNSNDTEIGANPDSKYGLKIEVKAESIDE